MTDKGRFFYGYVIAIISFLAMMLLLGLHSVFGIFFKPIIEELEWTRTVTSGAFSLSQIMLGLLGIVIGGLNDRFGPRVVMTLCGLLAALGYLLMSQVQSIWQMYLFYGVMIGVGSSVYVPLLSTVARWFVQRRSMMTGIVFAGAGVGTLILPLVTSQLISTYDWRVSCLILGAIILVVVVSSAQFLKRDPGQVGQIPYGENKITEEGLRLGTKDFSPKEAARTRQFWTICIAEFTIFSCLLTTIIHITPHARDLGLQPASAAAVLSAIVGASIIGRIVMGSANDKIGGKRSLIICFILLISSLVWLQMASNTWMLFFFAVIYGFAHGGFFTVMSPMVAELFGTGSHGLLFGMVLFSGTIGGSVGPLLAGHIFDVTGSYRAAFITLTALALIGFALITILRPLADAREERLT